MPIIKVGGDSAHNSADAPSGKGNPIDLPSCIRAKDAHKNEDEHHGEKCQGDHAKNLLGTPSIHGLGIACLDGD